MYMHKIREHLCEKLEDYAKNGINSGTDLEVVHKLTDTIKNIDKIDMYDRFDEDYDERYSRRSYGRTYHDDGSYRKRDSMGRFARDGRDEMSNRYSRDAAKSEIEMHLKDLLHIASTNKEREAIEEALEAVKHG